MVRIFQFFCLTLHHSFFPVMGWAGPWLNIFYLQPLFLYCSCIVLFITPVLVGTAVTLVCTIFFNPKAVSHSSLKKEKAGLHFGLKCPNIILSVSDDIHVSNVCIHFC